MLRRLHVFGPATRAALATELGLNRSTIKAVVDGLVEDGVVEESVPRQRSGAGRPSLLVMPRSQAAAVLAVDIRTDRVAIAVVGIGGEMLGRNSWKLHDRTRSPDEVITHVIESTRILLEELKLEMVAAGVSVPGVVRRHDGLVHEAPNLHWTDVPLGQRLSGALGFPVHVGNDAELGALAEHVRGVARGASDAVYVSADIGVGGGVISSGAAMRGTAGYVGEVGHMVINPHGRPCYCGSSGCWETEVGEQAIARALGMSEQSPRGAIVAELRTADAVERLASVTEWLVLGLVNVVNVLGPELVVLGDLFTALPNDVVTHIGEEVRRRSLVSRAAGGTRVVASTFGADVMLIGAAELAFEPVLGLA
ncbi:putative NBD/HSP70 family sugar kinase [Herbihabitans rhizosphaerae]|uniref:Putative NBD/HSP70 family sugar kinase n=1 Tax=Herbihabitans rhizosphaerae TaxID=1872711 RepID=A0A4Q7KQV0_9PSEU|nr:putative NBD/HSP70 family sugar kinase [Herbihabitans rhizosphaerae]